jgi:ankyrin repeat protein
MKNSSFNLLSLVLLILVFSSIILLTSCNKVATNLPQTVDIKSNLTPPQNNSQTVEADTKPIQTNRTPLQEAVCNSSIMPDSANAKKFIAAARKTVDKLLNEGANVNTPDNIGRTPLFCATDQNIDVAEKLILRGANTNQSDINGWTPLMTAVADNNAKVIKLLIKNGANVNAKDKDNWSVLQQSLVNGCSTIVNDLEKVGAKLE